MLAQAVAHHHSPGEVKALIALTELQITFHTHHSNSIFVQEVISVTVDKCVEDHEYWTKLRIREQYSPED